MKILVCDKLEEKVLDKFEELGEITNISESKTKTEDLKRINIIISSFSTNFVDDVRGTNIKVATEAASGIVLMPEEEYSFNKLFISKSPCHGRDFYL